MALNDPQHILFVIKDVFRNFFPEIGGLRAQNFDNGQKWLQDLPRRYSKSRKMETIGPIDLDLIPGVSSM